LIGVAVVGVAWASWVWLAMNVTSIHQKNVTRELAEWGQEYSVINDDASAIRAAEMVEYMSWYYVPSPGYRGPADVEAAKESQRRKSIDRVVAALEKYTGLKLGANPERWAAWAKERVNDPGSHSGGKPAASPSGFPHTGDGSESSPIAPPK
jgi:hypothetical protein